MSAIYAYSIPMADNLEILIIRLIFWLSVFFMVFNKIFDLQINKIHFRGILINI